MAGPAVCAPLILLLQSRPAAAPAAGHMQIRDKDAEKELSKLRQEKAAEKKAKAVAMAAAWGDD